MLTPYDRLSQTGKQDILDMLQGKKEDVQQKTQEVGNMSRKIRTQQASTYLYTCLQYIRIYLLAIVYARGGGGGLGSGSRPDAFFDWGKLCRPSFGSNCLHYPATYWHSAYLLAQENFCIKGLGFFLVLGTLNLGSHAVPYGTTVY